MIRPYRIGIVGLNFGKHLIDHLLRADPSRYFQIAAVCDLDRTKTLAMAERLGVKAYTDLDELLADPAILVVGLFTGPSGRAALLRRIFEAGKDVITTKPFETDPAEAEAILWEARDRQRVIHLNSPAPTPAPDLAQVARWREQYELGCPIAARADIWVSYREKEDHSWYDDPGKCPVAPIFRLGIYLINDLISLFGSAEEVQVIQSRVFTRRPTPDNAQLGVAFANGALANIFASFCVDDAQPYRNSLTLNYERGTIYRNVGPLLSAKAKLVQMTLVTKGKSGRPTVLRKELDTGSGEYQWRAFHRALRRRELPTPGFIRELVVGLEVIAAMREAGRTGSSVRVGAAGVPDALAIRAAA